MTMTMTVHDDDDRKTSLLDKYVVHFSVDRPVYAWCTFCSMQCATLFLLITLLLAGVNVIPFSSEVPLYLRDHTTYRRMDMVYLAKEAATFAVNNRESQLDRSVQDVTFELMFVGDGTNTILTTQNLDFMMAREREVLATAGYDEYCHMSSSKSTSSRACTRRASVVNFFDKDFINPTNLSYSKYFDPLIPATVDFSDRSIAYVTGNWSLWNSTYTKERYGVSFAPIWQVVDSTFGVPRGNTRSLAVRVEYSMGVPLKSKFGYNSDVDRYKDQETAIGDFLYSAYDGWGDSKRHSGDGITMYYGDDRNLMAIHAIEQLLFISLSLTFASVMFVWMYISMMTGSWFIGTLGMGQIVFSLVPSILLYTYVFQQQYFGVFNILSIFIILGIGADDIFVFMDHFNATKALPTLLERMSVTYHHASKAMFVTSLTTMFAFLANSSSSFPAVYTFGIFSAVLVVVNYCSIITYWVAVVAVFNVHCESHRMCLGDRCCPSKCPAHVDQKKGEVVALRRRGSESDMGGGGGGGGSMKGRQQEQQHDVDGADDKNDNTTAAAAAAAAAVATGDDDGSGGGGGDVDKLGAIERFFRDVYGPRLVHHRIGRYVMAAAFIAILVVFLSFAAQLEPDPETPAIHKPGTNYGDFGKTKAAYFGGRLDNPRKFSVFLVFGVANIDRADTNPTNAHDRGQVVFDDAFNINTVADQLYLWHMCAQLANMATPGNDFKIESSSDGVVNIQCLMTAFQQWYDDEVTSPNSGKTNSSFRFPVRAAHCANNTDVACFTEALRRFFLDPTTRPLGLFPTTNLDHWDDYIFAEALPDGQPKLRMLMIEAKLDYLINSPFEDGIALYERWERWFATFAYTDPTTSTVVSSPPPDLKSGFQMTLMAWHYFFLQRILIAEAFTGITVSLILAFIVLTFATRNIIVSSLATLTITCIVMCVIGFIVMAGWKLGMLESINLILVPGLSVDYTVHLADSYLASSHADRRMRVNSMLTQVGVSIISGAVSTLGASLFMMFAPISFFLKFALFIFATILLSCLFSLGFFASVLAIMGPEGDTGSIQPFLNAVHAYCLVAIAAARNLCVGGGGGGGGGSKKAPLASSSAGDGVNDNGGDDDDDTRPSAMELEVIHRNSGGGDDDDGGDGGGDDVMV